jgi:hypothetical protein
MVGQSFGGVYPERSRTGSGQVLDSYTYDINFRFIIETKDSLGND